MTQKSKIILRAAAAVAVAALLLVYFAVDPEGSRWMPKCLFHELTGLDCPGCGAQRTIHALLHGHWSEAWHYNPFFIIAVPVAFLLGLVEFYQTRFSRLYRTIYRPLTFYLILLAIITWTAYRNI